jgi:hypothetical protein
MSNDQCWNVCFLGHDYGRGPCDWLKRLLGAQLICEGLFVAFIDVDVMTSPDGVTWTRRATP